MLNVMGRRNLGNEFTFVDVQVGATDTAGLDLDLNSLVSLLSLEISGRLHTKTSFSRSSGTGTSTILCFLGSEYCRARMVLGMEMVMIEDGMCVEEREGEGQIPKSFGMKRGGSKMTKAV